MSNEIGTPAERVARGVAWAQVRGREDQYEVNDGGDVRTLARIVVVSGKFTRRLPSRQIVQSLTRGYPSIALTSPAGRAYVHTLVLEAFVGPRPPGYQCRHLDGNPLNNRLTNLVWGSQAENDADKVTHGTVLYGARNPASKLTDEDVAAIRIRAVAGESQRSLAQAFRVSQSLICRIVQGVRWPHIIAERQAGGP